MRIARRGVALALVLAALVLAGALAAGAVMAAGQAMRDAAGSLARGRALAAAEQGLALASGPAWDAAWAVAGPPGLVAVLAIPLSAAVDTVRVVRLSPGSYLLISEAGTPGPALLSASARLGLIVLTDSLSRPFLPRAHAWTGMP